MVLHVAVWLPKHAQPDFLTFPSSWLYVVVRDFVGWPGGPDPV